MPNWSRLTGPTHCWTPTVDDPEYGYRLLVGEAADSR